MTYLSTAFQFILQHLTKIKDIFTIVGVVIAVRGLNTWNRQMRGQANYELARRIVRNTIALKYAILDLHRILISILKDEEVRQILSGNLKKSVTPFTLSQEPWERLRKLEEELDSNFEEAEALWGIKIKEDFLDLLVENAMIRHHSQWTSWSLKDNEFVSNQDKENIERFDEAKRKSFAENLENASKKAMKQVLPYLDPRRKETWLAKIKDQRAKKQHE